MAADRPSRMTISRFESAAEADQHDREFWMRLSPADRLLHAARLSEDQWRLKHGPPHEPGLRRPVTRLIATGRAEDLGDVEGLE